MVKSKPSKSQPNSCKLQLAVAAFLSTGQANLSASRLFFKRLGFASLLTSKPCPERDLMGAMVASRILCPATKLATTRLWHTSALAGEFGVADATEDDLYAAMDWLLAG